MRRDDANVTGGESDVGKPRESGKGSDRESRLMDREVPLPAAPGHAALHDWLDGDLEPSRVRDVEGGLQVDLWNRINAETQMLRSRTTPVHVQKAIMNALPDEAPALSQRKMIRPATLALVVVALVAGAAAFLMR